MLYLSVLDQDIIGEVLAEPSDTPYRDWFANDVETRHDLEGTFRRAAAALGDDLGMFAIGDESFGPNVFHDREYLKAYWGSVLEWITIEDKSWFKQAVVMLRKA